MASPSIRKPRLLVVDDDLRYLAMLPHLLGDIAEVECCGDDAEAMARLGSRRFDWVLLDVALGAADGFEVLARIGQLAHPPQVILHTGLALERGRERALEAGAVDLLVKPLSVPYLAGLLATGGAAAP